MYGEHADNEKLSIYLSKRYKEALKYNKQHQAQLHELECRIKDKNLALEEWKEMELKWLNAITSKRASNNPRWLQSLKNPYEPAAVNGELSESPHDFQKINEP